MQNANSLSAGAPVAHAGTKSDQKSTDQIPQRTDDADFWIDPQTFVHQRIAIDIGRVRTDGQQKCGHEAQLPLLAGFREGFAGSEEEGRGDARGSEDVAAEEEEGRGRQADETAAEQTGGGGEGAHWQFVFGEGLLFVRDKVVVVEEEVVEEWRGRRQAGLVRLVLASSALLASAEKPEAEKPRRVLDSTRSIER